MELVEINNKTVVYGYDDLEYEYVLERDGELVIKLTNRDCYFIDEGDMIYFNRVVIYQDNGRVSFNDFSRVKYEDEDHVIHATLPGTVKFTLSDDFYEIKHDEENLFHIIMLKNAHYLFGQDLEAAPQEVYFKSSDGTLLATCSGVFPLNLYRQNMGAPSEDETVLTSELVKEDCIVSTEKEKTCGKTYDYVETRHYRFAPVCESSTSFILTDFDEILCQDAKFIEFKFNPYYYYTIELGEKGEPIEFDSNNKPIRHCHFYGDKWFDSFHDTTTVKYVNDGVNLNKFYIDRSYYMVDVALSSDSNESNLGTEDFFSEEFAKKVENSLIPDFIDMERVKYAPFEQVSDDVYYPITSISIYNHFRERMVVDPENNTNTLSTSGNVYYDGWYIDTDNNYDIYWNGFGDESIASFIENNGFKSDLIGFLNFTDNDIFYRKSKVSKSFFRFSYYNSTDPIEQKLLYYSTVFLDSTELFCKFLKQSAFIEESDPSDVEINEIALGNNNVKTVFCENEDVGCRLDTTLTITNEYDKERCSEGFNIYLFADDIPDGNTEKTIYMRVEFNNAGNGKTTPMIVMPTDVPLTMENFMEHLYIPITIKKYNDKYIYTIDNGVYDGSGNLKLCLFEPKLEI